MSDMNLAESLERFRESMRRAASRARELSVLLKQPVWGDIATSLEGMCHKGVSMARSKGRGVSQVNSDIDNYKTTLATQETLH